MGQRVNPIGFRLQKKHNWLSQWFAVENYNRLVVKDLQIREFLEGLLIKADLLIGEIRIIRSWVRNTINVDIEACSTHQVANSNYDNILKQAKTGLSAIETMNNSVSIWLVLPGESMSATLLAQFLVESFEKNKYLALVEKDLKSLLLKCFRVEFAGRFSKKARRAKKRVILLGVVPTQSIRANLDYCTTFVVTKYGCVGIKVWLVKKSLWA